MFILLDAIREVLMDGVGSWRKIKRHCALAHVFMDSLQSLESATLSYKKGGSFCQLTLSSENQ